MSVNASSILSPLVIGAQLSIPLAIIFSSIFIGESIGNKKWILIIASFLGITLIGFDPKIADEILGLLLICCMAVFYALAQVFSRYLKELDIKFTNGFMGIVGCITLLILSIFFEGNTIVHLKNLNFEAWLMALHHGIFCSLMGHMAMFYLYKFYPVGQVLPFYALFPIFGIILSFFIFGEIPTLIMVAGGIIFALYFVGFAANVLPEALGEVIGYLSLSTYIPDFMRGVIDTRGIVYYLSITVLFLFLAIRSIESSRWN